MVRLLSEGWRNIRDEGDDGGWQLRVRKSDQLQVCKRASRRKGYYTRASIYKSFAEQHPTHGTSRVTSRDHNVTDPLLLAQQ